MKFFISGLLLLTSLSSFGSGRACYEDQMNIYDDMETILNTYYPSGSYQTYISMEKMVKRQMLHDQKCSSLSLQKKEQYDLIIEGLESRQLPPGEASALIENLSKSY